ncbi:MAG: hypothetical protein EHM59_21905, partial [Betaproteobacteria bacterium]
KAAGVAQLTQAMVDDAAVAALRAKVVATGRDDMAREAANLRVVLNGGKVLSASVERCIGSAGVPISDEDISRKTRGQLQTAYADAVCERIIEQCWRMVEAPRADRLCDLLRQVG